MNRLTCNFRLPSSLSRAALLCALALLAVGLFAIPPAVSAQDEAAQIAEMRAEASQLGAKARELKKQIKQLEVKAKEKSDGIKALKDEIRTLQGQEKEITTRSRNLSGGAFVIEKMPEIKAVTAKMKAVKPIKPRKVLIYSRTTGFRHGSIPMGVAVFEELGKATGAYSSESTEDPSVFTPEKLAEFDAIFMVNTTGKPVPDGAAQDAFEAWLATGKGLVGIHAATDCHSDWVGYRNAMGGIFNGHPWRSSDLVTLYNEHPKHPVCSCVPQGFQVKDEIYQYKEDEYFTRDKLRILLSLDLEGENMMKDGMKRSDDDYPVSWIRSLKGARVFYSNLGHNEATYINEVVLQHFLNGIQFALGDLEADSRPSAAVGKGKPKAAPADAK